ncbi:MAG: hypothetical protein ABL986_13925 [Vicinamibacterales bacterium]
MTVQADDGNVVVEGQVSQHAPVFVDIRESIRHLEHRMDAGFESVDRRFGELDQKMSRQFAWLVGIIVTVLVAVVDAMIARA